MTKSPKDTRMIGILSLEPALKGAFFTITGREKCQTPSRLWQFFQRAIKLLVGERS
ncbi:MAG: hypothetical protein NO515_03825 [Candidatus Methanomethylicia archaeon]|jgi:hypothetical protein|nr:hypothetical protein [Candidatus Methanomethylicia archaeon]